MCRCRSECDEREWSECEGNHVVQATLCPHDLRMIAAHAWDVPGALRAGCAAAFIARPGHALFPLGPRPDVVARDLPEAADRIIAAEPK